MTPAYFALVRPTYIENWPPTLHALSVPHRDIPLTLAEAHALGGRNPAFRDRTGAARYEAVDGLVERLTAALRLYPGGAFVRLGSRSGKDSAYAARHGMRVNNAAAALSLLTEDSARIAFDLRLALRFNYPPHLFVRRWLDIPAWSEFRCFVKERRLVGVSQYNICDETTHPEIERYAGRIKATIESFVAELIAVSHLPDVIFDLWLKLCGPAPDIMFSAQLIELNPFFSHTDACLFDWRNGGDFDRSFRFRSAQGLTALPLHY